MIPQQRQPGIDTCVHCGVEVRLVNAQLGPTWMHRGTYLACITTVAEPSCGRSLGVSRLDAPPLDRQPAT